MRQVVSTRPEITMSGTFRFVAFAGTEITMSGTFRLVAFAGTEITMSGTFRSVAFVGTEITRSGTGRRQSQALRTCVPDYPPPHIPGCHRSIPRSPFCNQLIF